MKDKVALLMEETGCEQGEAELALEMCGFDVEKALRAIPRLFHNIAALKCRFQVKQETLYALFLVILNLKTRSLLRARAVASYNPSVFGISLEQNWFEFEKHLYASRLGLGSQQSWSQELERVLAGYFGSSESDLFYSHQAEQGVRGKEVQAVSDLLSGQFHPGITDLVMHKDILDLGQFQEISAPKTASGQPPADDAFEGAAGSRHFDESPSDRGDRRPGSLRLRISLEGSAEGIAAEELAQGDLVYAQITDQRDIARYLAKVFGVAPNSGSLLVPVEHVYPDGAEVRVRVRFSLGACGDVSLPKEIRVKVKRKTTPGPWWKKSY